MRIRDRMVALRTKQGGSIKHYAEEVGVMPHTMADFIFARRHANNDTLDKIEAYLDEVDKKCQK